MKCIITIGFVCLSFIAKTQDCSSLLFSVYIEGSSSNKAIELFNTGEGEADLSDYRVDVFSNGATESSSSFKPKGVLLSGEYFSIAHPSSDSLLIANVDTVFGWSFNGNDAVALVREASNELIDVIGVVGEDPGASWSMSTGASKDMTMKRKDVVNSGSTEWHNASSLEWEVYDKDDFSVIKEFGANEFKKCVVSSLSTLALDEREILLVYNALGKEIDLTNAKGMIFIKYKNGDVERFFYE